MKKNKWIFLPVFTLFISSLLLTSGCKSAKPLMYERSLTGLDFAKYSRDGFLVTTGDYYTKYKSLSILRATCYDGYIKKDTPDSNQSDIWKNEDALYSEMPSNFNTRDYEYRNCKLSDLLDYMVQSAIKISANGIIKLEIEQISQESPVKGQLQKGILLKGLAIRFEE